MAPTETVNMVIAPGPPQDELPFLDRLGFKQTHSPLATLQHPKELHEPKTPHKPAVVDSSGSSLNSSRSGSSSTANSSSSSTHSQKAKQALPEDKLLATSTSSALALRPTTTAEQDLQAGRITSLISRMKYLADEGDNNEGSSIVSPIGGSLADQRSMIKSQAAKVRNQMELKFHSIPFFLQLDSLLDNAPGAKERTSYNPLQIIRDRKLRPHSDRVVHRVNMWQIPVSEQVQDMRWRYQCTKLKAQKLKKRARKAGSHSESMVTEGRDVTNVMPDNENEHEGRNGSSTSPERVHQWATDSSGTPQFINPFVNAAMRRQSQNSEGPTLFLPASSGGELIERLRSSHGSVDRRQSNANSDHSVEESKGSPYCDVFEIDPLSQSSTGVRRLFCRNSASVTDTWNRMRCPLNGAGSKSIANKRGNSAATSSVDDDLLKPLTNVQTDSSQSLSVTSKGSSISTSPDMFQLDLDSTSSVSLTSEQTPNKNAKSNNVDSQPTPPVVTVTSDLGEQKVLDPLKRTTRTGNLGSMRPTTPQKGIDMLHHKGFFGPTDDRMNDANICTFGSIRPGHCDVRKAPWERAAHVAEEDLEYYILLFRNALRREDLSDARTRIWRKFRPQDSCDTVSTYLKSEGVPHFLAYLGSVEQNVVSQQQILDADFASSLDALRVTTDRMVSEVNTTLNKQVREMSSRMEKLTPGKNCGLCTNASYRALEYLVLSLMWVIWGIVKMWRIVTCGFHVLRGGCNMVIIA